MRRYRFAPTAANALDQQIEYLVLRGAPQAARTLHRRVHSYITGTMCRFPFLGRFVPGRDVYETWIPGTRLLLWYTVSDTEVTIAMVWHASQDRHRDEAE